MVQHFLSRSARLMALVALSVAVNVAWAQTPPGEVVFADGFEVPAGAPPLPEPTGPVLWVAPNGDDSANGSVSAPLRTLARGCALATDGTTVRLTAGVFQESAQCVLRSGVRVMGSGADEYSGTLVLAPQTWDFRPDGTNDDPAGYVIRIDGISRATVDRLAFAGNANRANGAIRVRAASDVTLRDLRVRDFRYIGVHVSDTVRLDAQNLVIENSGLEWPPGASSQFPNGGSLGNLGLFGVTEALVAWTRIRTTALRGYGIKATNLERVRLLHLDLDLYPFQSWMGPGPGNFDIEIHGGFAVRVEIARSTFRQTLSLMGGNDPRYRAQPYSIHVHSNLFDMRNGVYAIEVGTDRMVVDHNWFRNTWSALQNFGDTTTRISDLSVFNNVAENLSMRFVGLKGRVENFRLFNNTVYLGPGGGQSFLVTLGSNNGSRHWLIANNAIIGDASNPAAARAFVIAYQSTAAPRDIAFRHNIYRDVAAAVMLGSTPVDPASHGISFSGNLETNPGLPLTGPQRLMPGPSSAVVDRGDPAYGIDTTFVGAGRDVGAFEYGRVPWNAGFGSRDVRDYLWAPTSSVTGPCFVDTIDIDMIAPVGVMVRYTLDGSEPGPTSTLYTKPVRLTEAARVRARAFHNNIGSATTLFLDLCRGAQGYPNLAATSTPTASSTYPEVFYSPQRAIDGITYSWQGWAPAANDPQAWLQLDLGAPARLRFIEFYTRAQIDDPATRRNFEIRASNDPSFQTYTVLHSQGATPLAHEAVLTREITDPTRWRYVRATKTASEFFFICELVVRGER